MSLARLWATAAAVVLLTTLIATPAFAQTALPYKAYGTSLQPGQTVEAFNGTTSVGRTTADATGNWVLDIQATSAVADDTITFTLDGKPTRTSIVFTAGQFSAAPGLMLVAGTAPPATTPAVGAGSTYTLQAGDTLYDLAVTWGTTADAIASVNQITDPTLLQIGEVLTIPGGSSAPAPYGATSSASSGGGTYSVQAGDNLSTLAALWNTTVDRIAQLNGLTNPDALQIGQQLKQP